MSAGKGSDLQVLKEEVQTWKELISRRKDREKKNTASEKEWKLRTEETFSEEEDAEQEKYFQHKVDIFGKRA